MNRTPLPAHHSGLSALRGAVDGIVGATDAVGTWDRLVWVWRILCALDGLIATLWGIVRQLREGQMALGAIGGSAMMVRVDMPVVARSERRLRRVVAGVHAVPERPGLTRVVAAARRVPGPVLPQWDWGWRGRAEGGLAPVVAAGCLSAAKFRWGVTENCALLVPGCDLKYDILPVFSKKLGHGRHLARSLPG
jgi:hypothetical protein